MKLYEATPYEDDPQPKFKIKELVGYATFGSNPNFKGRVIGIEAEYAPIYRAGFATERVATGFSYTVVCLCCDSTKHIREYLLERVEEPACS